MKTLPLVLPRLEVKTTQAPPTESKRAVAAFQVKADSINEAARTFTGLASTWDLDLGGDVIRKGAFKRTLQNWQKSKAPLPLLDSHNAWSTIRAVIGKLEEAEETDEGLVATFSVMDGPDGDEIWRRLKGGYVSGLSIGYRAMKQEAPSEEDRLKGIWRILTEVKLEEVSVCVWPMNPEARIDADSVKALTPEAIAAWTDEEKARIRALLEPAPAEPEAPAHYEKQDALKLRLRRLALHRPGTRASA
jgi:HK97 family phage prohead protease